MKHTCHAHDCDVAVPPKMFMCKKHWFSLTPELRRRIWSEYRPGQEVDKSPSEAYLAVADEAIQYALEMDAYAAGFPGVDGFGDRS